MQKTSRFEKIAYALGDSGGGMFIWTFASSFLTLYYTDSVLLSAETVGTLMLVTRFLDGFSDILFGMLLERTHTRIGKARPWFGVTIIPLVVSFWLVFNVPSNIGDTTKLLYVVVTYFLLTVVTYTINNLAYHAMLSRISLDANDRNVISSIRGIIAGIMGVVVSVGSTMLINALGGEKKAAAWTVITLIYGIVCLIMQGICFFGTKEKIPAVKEDEKGESVKEGFRVLFHTKYFYIALFIFILHYIASGTMTGAAVFYVRDVMGNSNLYGLLAIALIAPGIVGQIFVPALTKKFGKKKPMIVSSVICIVCNIIGVLNADNLIVILIILSISSVAGAPFSTLIFTFAPDLVDYLEAKTGKRWEGLATSANSFGIKVGTGLGSALVGWVLAAGNYEGSLAVQPASALTAEIVLVFIIPIIATALRGICAAMWDL